MSSKAPDKPPSLKLLPSGKPPLPPPPPPKKKWK